MIQFSSTEASRELNAHRGIQMLVGFLIVPNEAQRASFATPRMIDSSIILGRGAEGFGRHGKML